MAKEERKGLQSNCPKPLNPAENSVFKDHLLALETNQSMDQNNTNVPNMCSWFFFFSARAGSAEK